MKKSINAGFAFVLGLLLLAAGWFGGVKYAQRSIRINLHEERQEAQAALYRHIDSLNRQSELNKELIVRLASKLDSLQKAHTLALQSARPSAKVKYTLAKKDDAKKEASDAVVTMSDAELEFFNTYIENEKDIDF